jgi:hypothetical protein
MDDISVSVNTAEKHNVVVRESVSMGVIARYNAMDVV